jgi:beta-lactamase class A
MKRKICSLLLLAFTPIILIPGPNPEQDLPAQLNDLVKDFRGDDGIYVCHLKSGETVEIQADSLFPTASMIKVPIMIKIFDMIEHGELDYDSTLTWYADSINYPYEYGILSSFQDGKTIPLDEVVSLMITYSDNHAALWCQKLAGGTEINGWLDSHGLKNTRVNSRTEGRKSDWEKYGWGQTTPREMAELLVLIREGKAVSPAASEEMYRVLTRIYWNNEALSQIPPYIQAASKQGAVDESRSEVVLVNAPSGDYVFCVITRNQQDTSWERDNEGYVLIRNVSKLLWGHFEPDHPWSPAKDGERSR